MENCQTPAEPTRSSPPPPPSSSSSSASTTHYAADFRSESTLQASPHIVSEKSRETTTSDQVSPSRKEPPPPSWSEQQDVRLWLEYTGYFDLNHRNKILAFVKQLKGLEVERAKVLMKIQNSRSSAAPAPAADIGMSPQACAAPSHEPDHDEELLARPPPPPPPHSPHPPFVANPRPLCSHDFHAPSMREMQQQQKQQQQQQQHVLPRPAPRKETRFFLVKSSNTTNVYMSRRDCLWITQAKNGPTFMQAFDECKSVILFFSINKSKAFQGYARMTSLPDATIPQPSWITTTTRELHTTHPFRISWLNDAETPFAQLGDLRNPYNDYLPVFVARDGQECSEECGRKMMQAIDRVKAALGSCPPVASSSASLPAAVQGASRSSSSSKKQLDAKKRHALARAGAGAAAAAAAAAAVPHNVHRTSTTGLGASKWRRAAESEALYATLDAPQPVEDLLLDYP